MIIPIIAYGHRILRRNCKELNQGDDKINLLAINLWQTLDSIGGVGLAAPQINNKNSVFIVSSKLMYDGLDDDGKKKLFPGDKGITETFINPKITARSQETWNDFEGCLSIPGIEEQINRSWEVEIEYFDLGFKFHKKQYSGYTAKVIQHEYDHTQGILFIDHLSPLKKKLISSKLKNIINGKVETKYKVKFVNL